MWMKMWNINHWDCTQRLSEFLWRRHGKSSVNGHIKRSLGSWTYQARTESASEAVRLDNSRALAGFAQPKQNRAHRQRRCADVKCRCRRTSVELGQLVIAEATKEKVRPSDRIAAVLRANGLTDAQPRRHPACAALKKERTVLVVAVRRMLGTPTRLRV